MNEAGDRLLWILGAVVVAVAAVLIVRSQRDRRRPVRIAQATLGVGVYLFTSASCPDCEVARALLAGEIGSNGFVELSWESDPAILTDIGVRAVPATLIVTEAGGSILYSGRPDKALESLSP